MTPDYPIDTIRRPIAQGQRVGNMEAPVGVRAKRLKGWCPDGTRCTTGVPCSELCLRLESAEITAEMQRDAKAQRGK